MPTFVYFGMILMVVAGSGALYVKNTRATIMELTSYNATLTAQVDQMDQINKRNVETINNLQADYKRSQENMAALQENFANIRRQNNDLRDRLGKHELDVLAAAKPVLVERIVNNASAKAMRCFELESGALLTDAEKEATNAKAFNSECPWVYDDLVARGVLVQADSATTTENRN
jgi:chromosome segregation ATPase